VLVAISRGGATHDRVADCLWLTGLVSPQPFVPDLEGHWRGAGHVAVVLGVEGPTIAVVDSEALQSEPAADRVVVSDDVIAAAADAVATLVGSSSGRVGLLGADVLPAHWWAALEERLGSRVPRAGLEPVDELSFELRRVKSPGEQELLRVAGRLGASAMTAALETALPGNSEADVAAALCERVVREGGAIYGVVVSSGVASGTLAPSGGAAGVAGWTTRPLAHGDLLRLDAFGSLGGYLFDLARSVVVGGEASREQAELIEALRESVAAGVTAVRPGVPLSHVADACENALASSAHARRYGVPAHVMGGFWGHGLGLGFEPPWIGNQSREIIEEGWCLAIERRAAVPGLGGAQHEDDLIVTAGGAELLTATGDDRPTNARGAG
jgi:Xaa-Pro aminopeptidase